MKDEGIFYLHCAKKKKITNLILTFVLMLSFGIGYSQDFQIDLNEKNVPIKTVFKKIEKQSGYSFFYNEKVLDDSKKVTIQFKGKLNESLNTLFKKFDIGFKIEKSHIILFTKNKDITVYGIVVDDNGVAMPGVNIVVKNTTKGTLSDVDGKFSLTLDSEFAGKILDFSSIGLTSQSKTIFPDTEYKIVMKEDAVDLDEIVVVGYGTTTKKKIVSSIVSVKSDELKSIPIASVSDGLAGRAAGLFVNTSGGEPGTMAKISIRGGGTPIFVIDDIIQDERAFNSLNPEDIESISVLKDAGAAAIYGAKAADGIVLVKTKDGNGKLQIQYNNNFAWSKPTQDITPPGAFTYMEMFNKLDKSMGRVPRYDDQTISEVRNGTSKIYTQSDWYNEVVRDYAPQFSHNLTVSGGENSLKYYLGLGNYYQESRYKSNATDYERNTYRMKVTSNFESIGLKVSAGVNGSIVNNKRPPYSTWQIWSHMSNQSPLTPIFNEDGTLYSTSDHPLAELNSPGYNKEKTTDFNGHFSAELLVPKVEGLKLKFLANYQNYNYSRKQFQVLADQYDKDGNMQPKQKPKLFQRADKSTNMDMQFHIDYARSFGKHNLGLLMLYTQKEYEGDYFDASRENYASVVVDQMFAGDDESQKNGGSGSEAGSMGCVGRFTYDYDSRYILQLSGRYDGSDRFEDGERWGLFPSVSLGWVVSDEFFMKSLKQVSKLSNLKLKFSYGEVGQNSGANFDYLSTYNRSGSWVVDGKTVAGYEEGALVSNALSWYDQTSYNTALEFSFFNNRLNGSFDYFYTRTTGYLTDPKDKYTTPLGKALPKVKSDAANRRDGFEYTLSYNDNIGDVNYKIGGNVSIYRTLVEVANESETDLKNPKIRATQRKNDSWGRAYQADGYYQTNEDILNNPRRLNSNNLRPGDLIYKDLNGDGRIDGEDFTFVGDPQTAHLMYGVNFELGYKGLVLSGLVQGTGSRSMYMETYIRNADMRNEFQNDMWTEENRGARFPRPTDDGTNSNHNATTSTHWLMDGQYIRLKNLVLSYDLKYSLLNTIDWVEGFSVYVSGTNLLTSSDALDYMDPESSSLGNFGYPVNKVYSLGMKVNF